MTEFLGASKTLQDASYIHEFAKAFARCGDWLRFDPQRVSELVDDTELKLMHLHASSVERFVTAVDSSRRSLRLINGGAQQ